MRKVLVGKVLVAVLCCCLFSGCAVARFPKRHPMITGFIAGGTAASIYSYQHRMVNCEYGGFYDITKCPKGPPGTSRK